MVMYMRMYMFMYMGSAPSGYAIRGICSLRFSSNGIIYIYIYCTRRRIKQHIPWGRVDGGEDENCIGSGSFRWAKILRLKLGVDFHNAFQIHEA